MKKLITILTILILTGCEPYYEGPTEPINKKTRTVTITIHDTYKELAEHPQAPSTTDGVILKGFARFNEQTCKVHYVHNDYETLVHELKHCYYGSWHD